MKTFDYFVGVLPDDRQSAFVKDRQLMHGVLVANEVVEEARRSKRPCMVFKVDFEKAYDEKKGFS